MPAEDKQLLLHILRDERARLEAMLDQMNEEQLQRPGAQGDWSVLDIVVHLTVWERRGTSWIRTLAEGRAPAIPLPGYTWDDVDELNRDSYEAHHDLPLADTLSDFADAFQALVSEVTKLDDSDLDRTFAAYWADHEPRTLRDLIRWRFQHYRSHGKAIRAWLEKLAAE